MLVLTRQLGQTILIGDDIRITILAINNEQVRVGIDAPKSINVIREEVIDRQKKQLSKSEESKPRILLRRIFRNL